MRSAMLAGMLLAVLLVCLAPVQSSAASQQIVVDGDFADWEGRAHVDDPEDVHHDTYDLQSLYWGNNPNEDRLYFMIHRYEPDDELGEKGEVYYSLFVDSNNNGRMDDPDDRVVDITFEPDESGGHGEHGEQGLVTVDVWRGNVRVGGRQGYWGERADEGGRRAEFYVTFNEIGTGPGHVIRMVLFATDKNHHSEGSFGHRFGATFDEWNDMVEKRWADRLPDTGDLQWSPIPTLPLWADGILVLFATALVAAGRRQAGRWTAGRRGRS